MVSIYVDDFTVFVLENLKRKRTLGAAVRIRNLMRAQLKRTGFGCHKEMEGSPIPAVGVVVGGEACGGWCGVCVCVSGCGGEARTCGRAAAAGRRRCAWPW